MEEHRHKYWALKVKVFACNSQNLLYHLPFVILLYQRMAATTLSLLWEMLAHHSATTFYVLQNYLGVKQVCVSVSAF